MSDFTIPGVTSNIDTGKMIKALMDVEKVKLTAMQKDVDTYTQTKKAWQDLNLKLSRLKDSSSTLYGFQNPFGEKMATTSDESILTANASREAMEEEKEIIVKRLATADKFISRSQDNDYKVPSGNYEFQVGEKKVSFKFNGGSLKEFADALNTKTNKLLKASVVNDTKNTRVLLIEGTKTGSKNRVEFLGKSIDFALETGILEVSHTAAREVTFDPLNFEAWEKPLNEALFSVNEGNLNLRPGAEMKLPISPPLPLNRQMVLQFDVVTEQIPEETRPEEQRPPGPTLPNAGEIIFKGIKIENEKSIAILPKWQPPEPPVKVEDMNVLSILSGDKVIILPPLKQGSATIEIPIGEYAQSIDALLLSNKNTHKIISFENIRIYDPTARGDYRPVNPLTEAADALISMDGIEITRETNDIDDLIPGVELILQSASEDPVDLAIKPDKELIKESIVNFVGHYNNIITTVDILSRNDESVLDNLAYLEEADKELLKKNVGLLQGEATLMQLKSRLQTIMMNPYTTSDATDLKLLAQIGVATSTARPGTKGSVDKVQLRGYLQIDEKQLDIALDKYKSSLKELFGWDTDGDLIVDTGLAYTLDGYIKPYTTLGGILSNKLQTLDTRISRKEDDIEDYNKHLTDYESKLKRDYAMMEGMLDSLKKNSDAIDNFNQQNSGR